MGTANDLDGAASLIKAMRFSRRLFSRDPMLGLAEAKLSSEIGSLKHALAVQEQGIVAAARGDHDEAASVFLHAASVRARHLAAHSLARSGRTREAVSELKENLRLTKKEAGADSAQAAQRMVSLGKLELLAGNVEEGASLLEQAMHTLHRTLGHAHPLAHETQRLWVVCEMCDWTQPPHKEDLLRSI